MKKKKNFKRLLSSFKYAFEGIINTYKTEQNILIHNIIAILVTIFGILFKINIYEWIICIILFGLVISAELFNTAIEAIVDLNCKSFNKYAKIAKDSAAGAVLILALTSVIIGCIIFLPKIFQALN